jgi:two-component system, OmpR family, sensor histidine kinase MprB
MRKSGGRFGRFSRLSMRWRLSLSFAGITILAVLVVAAVLIPIMAGHYAGTQQTYLEAGAERAVRDLSALSWKKEAPELVAAVRNLALVTRARVKVTDTTGALLVDSGPAAALGPSDAAFPDPFGGTPDSGALARSGETIERPVLRNGRVLGNVSLSEAPDYAGAALRQVVEALGLAGLLGVVVAALVGWVVSSRFSRPLRELREASDRMARGDLSVRAQVGRGDEVGQLADSFNTMVGEVEKTLALRQRFVADAAHEFGTPLTALQANLELAQIRVGGEEERSLIDASLAEARRLERLSADLLRLSRLEAGQIPQEQQPVELTQLVRDYGDAVASRAEQKDVEVRLDVPDEPVWVPAYADQLATAFGNLVDNALKFTRPGGTVELGARPGVLWVKDTGPGIPSEDMPGLFERFHRGRNSMGHPGSGLGLAIVRAVMTLHGGSVGVESGPDGSRFELRLPARLPAGTGA